MNMLGWEREWSVTETVHISFHLLSRLYNNLLSVLIKIQRDATVYRYLFTAKSLYMFRVSQHPSSGVLKTVTAASGTGHNTGTATSLQRGPIGRTSIMTCTGDCGYSF